MVTTVPGRPQDALFKKIERFWAQYSVPIISTLVILFLLGVGWGGLSYYRYRQESRAATLYALLPPEEGERQSGLAELADKYPTTGAGIYARFQLGRKAFEGEKYDEAIAWYEPLVDLGGQQAMIQFMTQNNLAAALEAKGEWDRALVIYEVAATDPNNISRAYAYYHLGRVSQVLGRSEESRRWFQEAIKYGSGMPVADRASERLLWLDIGSR